ncbi:MAG: biotin transporter BioY [Clostridium sp.]
MEKSVEKKKTLFTTKQMTLIGVMTAVICILGPFVIPLPFSPVPISFTNLAIYFTVYVLGAKLGTISYLIYLLLGCAGLPVFSGFTGGFAKLAGPTGGYLVGFIFMAVMAGYFVEKFPGKIVMHVMGMVLGTIVCYIFGTVWLSNQLGIPFVAGLGAGVIPYLPGDIAKIILAVMAGPKLRREVLRATGVN